jgi:hypothetical protein
MWQHYRGAFGRSEEQQEAEWAEASTVSSPPVAGETTVQVQPSAPHPPGQTKLRVRFYRTLDGETTVSEVEAFEGETVMDVAKREGLEPIEGVCGGHLGKWQSTLRCRCLGTGS